MGPPSGQVGSSVAPDRAGRSLRGAGASGVRFAVRRLGHIRQLPHLADAAASFPKSFRSGSTEEPMWTRCPRRRLDPRSQNDAMATRRLEPDLRGSAALSSSDASAVLDRARDGSAGGCAGGRRGGGRQDPLPAGGGGPSRRIGCSGAQRGLRPAGRRRICRSARSSRPSRDLARAVLAGTSSTSSSAAAARISTDSCQAFDAGRTGAGSGS